VYFRFYFAMALLDDGEAERIRDGTATTSHAPTLVAWIRALLDDRKSRNALLLRLTRELQHVRGRLRQAARYLDGLVGNVQRAAGEPWPGQLPCPVCGAPVLKLATRQDPSVAGSRVVVHVHADGKRCEGRPDPR